MTIHSFLTSYGEFLTKKVSFSPPYYDNTNRLRRAFPGNTNPEVNNSVRACEGTVLTKGLVFPGKVRQAG